MPVKTYLSQYKDQPAVTIASGTIAAQFLPTIGAKMASLVYRPLERELFVQRPGARYLLQPFEGDYVAGECSGFDDMFPTIDACFYDRFPWQGVKMADHGEVWSLGWEYKVEAERLYFATNGVRFPYRLEKWAHFTSEEVLRVDYRLTNLSDFDFDFLWAGHTMINIEEGVELVLPHGIEKVVRTFNIGRETAHYGDEVDWPVGMMADGSQRDLRVLRPKAARLADKYYIKGKLPEGWCGLKYPASDFSLGLTFPLETVPYLGVLPNEGGWQDLYNIFLEPCTASFDRPDAARYRGEVSTVKGKSSYTWYLQITLAQGVEFKRILADGKLEV